MKSFSQRHGFKPVKTAIQLDSIDAELHNKLWDGFKIYYWNQLNQPFIQQVKKNGNPEERGIIDLLDKLWHFYYVRPMDTINDYLDSNYNEIRKQFYECEWYEVYDFIEFVANNYPDKRNKVNPEFIRFCNDVLEQELSAYRFVGKKIAQITSEIEIDEIEEALEISDSFNVVKIHLKRALDLLVDRKSPDYRNSIKESITAVEAICQLITNDDKATLGKCLKAMQNKNNIDIHPSLSGAFSKIYGYTNGADGIRHALSDESKLNFEDAKLMLILCSGFINYLISKSLKT